MFLEFESVIVEVLARLQFNFCLLFFSRTTKFCARIKCIGLAELIGRGGRIGLWLLREQPITTRWHARQTESPIGSDFLSEVAQRVISVVAFGRYKVNTQASLGFLILTHR